MIISNSHPLKYKKTVIAKNGKRIIPEDERKASMAARSKIYDENGNTFLASYHTKEEAEVVANFYNAHDIQTIVVHGAEWQDDYKQQFGIDLHTVYIKEQPDTVKKIEEIPDEDYKMFMKEFNKISSQKDREYEEEHHCLRKTL